MNYTLRALLITPFITTVLSLNLPAEEKMKDADNTARNQTDRHHEEVTPIDQSNNPEDVTITSRIRKAIVAQKSLSVDAHNVKIITANGRVTLRGPVQTEDEKRIVAGLAVEVASASNVDNQLEVKSHN